MLFTVIISIVTITINARIPRVDKMLSVWILKQMVHVVTMEFKKTNFL